VRLKDIIALQSAIHAKPKLGLQNPKTIGTANPDNIGTPIVDRLIGCLLIDRTVG
jgi:hypothetical protein